jgi:KaiC/GvpD/RAD55 family RecA-like ATPase
MDSREFLSHFPGFWVQTLDDKIAKGAEPRREKPRQELISLNPARDITMERLKELNSKEAGIFFSPNSFDKERKKDSCQGINAWVVESDDLTKEQQWELILKSPLNPTFVIETSKSYHIYFLAKEQVEYNEERFTKIVNGLIQFFSGDPACKDSSRVFRIPDFYHNKKEPVMVKLVHEDLSVKYTEEEMLKAFPYAEPTQVFRETYGDDLWKLKEIPIMQVLDRLGVPCSRGQVLIDGQPSSMVVNEKDNYVNRFSGKPGSGSTIDVVREFANLDTGGAIQWLQQQFNIQLPKMDRGKLQAKKAVSKASWINIYDLVQRAEEERQNISPDSILEYGYDFLDSKLGGIFPGELTLLGGITGTGKTTFASLVAKNVAKKNKVAVIALEDRLNDYSMKMLYFEIGKVRGGKNYPWIAYRRNEIKSPTYEQEKHDAYKNFDGLKLDFLDIKELVNIDILEELITRKAAEGVKFFVLDHLHVFDFGEKAHSKERIIEEMMKRISKLKDNLGLSIVLVAHFKKVKESDKPTMSDFKDAMAIAQNSNTVLMLWRDKGMTEESQEYVERSTTFICPKGRGAMTEFTAEVFFDKEIGDYVTRDEKMGVPFDYEVSSSDLFC